MTEPRARRYYYATQAGTLFPIFILLAIAQNQPGPVPPGVVCAIGILIGLQLLLTGSYGLNRETRKLGSLARKIIATQDEWFPLLVFFIQNTALILVLTVLWFTIIELGVRAPAIQTFSLLGVFALVPLRRFMDALSHTLASRKCEALADALAFPVIMLLVLFVVSGLAQWLSGAYEGIPGQSSEISSPPFLILWVPVVLLSITCLSVFVIRIYRAFTMTPEEAPEKTKKRRKSNKPRIDLPQGHLQ